MNSPGTAAVATSRHRNGGGLKVSPAECSPDAYLDEESSVEGETQVYTSSLLSSALKDSFAYGSRLSGSLAEGSRLADCRLSRSRVTRSDVCGALVSRATLYDCRVFGDGGEVPELDGVALGGVSVFGGAKLV
ncbi:MAG: hypothetical protein M3348_01670, partial [Acidobacteriota bacterium]|nr:hypothetical protein [Acidobacteriota bacterium]